MKGQWLFSTGGTFATLKRPTDTRYSLGYQCGDRCQYGPQSGPHVSTTTAYWHTYAHAHLYPFSHSHAYAHSLVKVTWVIDYLVVRATDFHVFKETGYGQQATQGPVSLR
jgi:hypothetical protein